MFRNSGDFGNSFLDDLPGADDYMDTLEFEIDNNGLEVSQITNFDLDLASADGDTAVCNCLEWEVTGACPDVPISAAYTYTGPPHIWMPIPTMDLDYEE